jgi:hypothetical protein
MPSDSKLDFVIASFSALEAQLQDCLNYIPFIENNKSVLSPRFTPIVMESCSLIDSIFSRITNDKSKKYNLKKYADLHESTLSLEGNISLFLGSPLRVLQPYRDWTSRQPDWWAAYNALKHDRINNYEVATYTNAIQALAGLHQLIARCKFFIGGFLRAGWLDTQGFDLIADLGSAAHLGPLHPSPPIMVIESRFFASPTRENFINSADEEEPLYLDINFEMPGLSNRLRNFVFAHEDW